MNGVDQVLNCQNWSGESTSSCQARELLLSRMQTGTSKIDFPIQY